MMEKRSNHSDEEDLWMTPKALRGAGDGHKTFKHVPSTPKKSQLNSRKATDREEKIKRKTPIDIRGKKMENSRLKKACSVAEITPTKTRTLKRLNVKSSMDTNDKQTLHATPRPLLDDAENGAAAAKNTKILARPCDREWAACTVYQRLLLCVWRRSKRDLIALNESCRRHIDQINQLQLQINCLKELSNAESAKRKHAVNERIEMERKCDRVVMENEQLRCDLSHLQMQLNGNEDELIATKDQLNLSKRELDDVQSLLDGKTEEISTASNKLLDYDAEIKRLTKEKCDLEDKLLKVEHECANLSFIQCENDILRENLQNDLLNKDKLIDELHQHINELRDVESKLNEELAKMRNDLAMPRKIREIWKTFQYVTFSCAYFLNRFANLLLPAYKL